jgi:tetratricopeptide (TPR) repeat protein
MPIGRVIRLRPFVSRLPLLLILLGGLAPPARSQERVSPLPPPVTRGLYRSHWFEFLNAHLDDDARGAAVGLAELMRAAQALGVHRLSDFSRTAVYEGRQAEAAGQTGRAARAYQAALDLDEGNCDAHFTRLAFLLRRGSYGEAVAALPRAAASLLETREARLAILSASVLWASIALAAAISGTILILLLRHLRVSRHVLGETARRFFGRGGALPLALILLGLPLAFGLGPLWLLLYWGVLAFSASSQKERAVLGAALLVLGLVPPIVARIAHENIVQRSPLYAAAVDLEEKREDASAEDGLRQASTVFREDPDIWFLLGILAERSSDRDRALAAYDRAVRVAPGEYEPLVNRGNIQFQEGNVQQAIADYESAAEKAPRAPEVYYNLSLARAETYDFEGQAQALQKAREISASKVANWSRHPTLARVVSVSFPLSRARARVEEWNREPRGARLPGHAPTARLREGLLSPFAIGPWVALLLGVLLFLLRSWRGAAAECVHCGRPHCKYCRRYGDPPGYCVFCARSRKEARGIDVAMKQAERMRRVTRGRDLLCRTLSVLFPGTHRFFTERPISGFGILFLFFFLVAAAVMDSRFFGVRPLSGSRSWTGGTTLALAGAAVLWMTSLWSAWRRPHES